MLNYNTKYLTFYKAGEYPKTEHWVIASRTDSYILAQVKWYGPWRQYIMFPESGNILFNKDCLQDIVNFLKDLNKEYKENQGGK